MKIPSKATGRPGVNPLRHLPGWDADVFAVPNLFLFGREPFQLRVFDDVIQRDLVAWIIPKDVLSLCVATPGIT